MSAELHLMATTDDPELERPTRRISGWGWSPRVPSALEGMRMALCEVGRTDLAFAVAANRVGNPMIGSLAEEFPDDTEVIARAACLAHEAAGTRGWTYPGPARLASDLRWWVERRRRAA